MSEQWKGLHYHDRHVTAARLGRTIVIATIQRQDSTFERQMEEHEELEALRAQVQRVREAVAYAERNYDAPIVTIGAIKIALDGGDA